MRERQEGRYYGLGISIQVVGGDITVVNVFEGSPAYQRGMRRGDVIAKIENDDTKGWTSDQAVGKLRGPRGTSVAVSLRRERLRQADRPEGACATRFTSRPCPPSSCSTRTTGYIRVTDFGENTDQELGAALSHADRARG